MELPLPSEEAWPENTKVEYHGSKAAIIKDAECLKLMEHYGSTFEINRIITLKKHPDPILSHEDCKVKLLAVYAMASYEKEEAAIHANRTNAKLVGKTPEVDMTKKQVHELLFALAHKGTAYLACYRTPVWEIVWRFVEIKEIALYDDGKVPWLRDPHRLFSESDSPAWIEEAKKIQPRSASTFAKTRTFFRVSEIPPDPASVGISDACEQPLE